MKKTEEKAENVMKAPDCNNRPGNNNNSWALLHKVRIPSHPVHETFPTTKYGVLKRKGDLQKATTSRKKESMEADVNRRGALPPPNRDDRRMLTTLLASAQKN